MLPKSRILLHLWVMHVLFREQLFKKGIFQYNILHGSNCKAFDKYESCIGCTDDCLRRRAVAYGWSHSRDDQRKAEKSRDKQSRSAKQSEGRVEQCRVKQNSKVEAEKSSQIWLSYFCCSSICF